MALINENYANLQSSYLFANIARKVAEFQKNNPDADIIRLGIGDVTRPLAPAVIEAMHKAVDEMGQAETFRGYGPEQGYEFLRQAVVDHDYKPLGINLDIDEVFISDGAKSDVGNIQELFSANNVVAITDRCIRCISTAMSWADVPVSSRRPFETSSTYQPMRKITFRRNFRINM